MRNAAEEFMRKWVGFGFDVAENLPMRWMRFIGFFVFGLGWIVITAPVCLILILVSMIYGAWLDSK